LRVVNAKGEIDEFKVARLETELTQLKSFLKEIEEEEQTIMSRIDPSTKFKRQFSTSSRKKYQQFLSSPSRQGSVSVIV